MTQRSRIAGVLLVTTVGGAGTMVVELAAVRLLAPWFGSSQVVWTNVIAVVLLALALGYLVGGRLAGSGRPVQRLSTALLLAGAVTLVLPGLSGRVAELFLPAGLALQEAADLVLWGSLASSLVLFLPPAAVLGTVAPLAVEAVQELEERSAGHAGGAVLASSTVGSLAGVWGTSHVLLPGLGLTWTFVTAALTLMVAGLLGLLVARRGPGPVALVLLGLLGAAALFGGGAKRPEVPEGMRTLAQAESSYQSVRVVEDARGAEPLRYLQVNEGFDSYQSVWQSRAGLLPPGFYYNDFALPPAWSEGDAPWRLLVLGLGGGTAVRVIEGALPDGRRLDSLGVELDPVVVRFAREHLDLAPDAAGREAHANLDARLALRLAPGLYDQIVLDCYANQVEIPAHLCTEEFFREVRERLADGGWLSVNLGGFGFEDPVVEAVAATCARAFEADALLLRVPFSRNFSLIARRDAPLPVAAEGRLASARGPAAELLGPRELPDSWRLVPPPPAGDPLVLTDDRCPIEELQVRSIREGAGLLAGGAAR
jgi:spermidine synthase